MYTVTAEKEFPVLNDNEICTEGAIYIAEGNGKIFLGGMGLTNDSIWIEVDKHPNLAKIDDLGYSEIYNIALNGPHLSKLAHALKLNLVSKEMTVKLVPNIGDTINI